MSAFLLDSDTVTLFERGHPTVTRNYIQRISDIVLVCVITVEEQLVGWLSALNQTRDYQKRERVYQRMARSVSFLSGWPVLPFTAASMLLHESLVKSRLNVKSNDLKIAAIALEIGATVVTRNFRDFTRVPGVKCVDWSV